MKRAGNAIPILYSIRTKLLFMLAVLSVPLLVISLIELGNYRKDLNDQATTIARIETTAATGALAAWLEGRPTDVVMQGALTDAEARDLFKRLDQQTSSNANPSVAVFDAQGHPVLNPAAQTPLPSTINFSNDVARVAWSDNVTRMTGMKRVEPFGWTIVVGVPLAENTLAGRSVFALTATWAFALVSSILLGVWAVGRFTKPLRKLATSASTFGEGKFGERVAVETEDEVGALAESFNGMATQLQRKFNEVQSQGAFIEEVMDGLPLGVAVLDTSLLVRKANPMFASFIGREAALLSGRGLYEAAAGLAVLSEAVEDVRRTRKPFVTYGLPLSLVARAETAADETEISTYWDVTIWPTSAQSRVRGDMILILSEVSKRVRAEKLATAAFANERTRAAELESIINQMIEGVVIIDPQGRYKVNPAAAKILGRQRETLLDGARAFINDIALRDLEGRELPLDRTPLWRALEGGESISGEQLKIVRPDGETSVLAVSATPLTGADGAQEGAVAVFRDITEEVRHHDELVAAYDRLREHDRLKSAFVSNMTHELRTPLNVIIGLCQLLERDPQLPLAPLQDDAVTRMERNARSLLELVNDLLDYSRLEAGRTALRLESLDVSAIIKEVIDDYADESVDKRIELRMDVSADLGSVLTDRHKLAQVLSNLVGNAVKFTGTGAVTISAGPSGGEHWYLEVSDTGIGIPREALAYIFDEFRQVDDRLTRAYGGTGLGLAITRKIVELLEGEITVESTPQEGSRFRITWPRAVRQRTGTGSLVEKDIPSPFERNGLRLHVR